MAVVMARMAVVLTRMAVQAGARAKTEVSVPAYPPTRAKVMSGTHVAITIRVRYASTDHAVLTWHPATQWCVAT